MQLIMGDENSKFGEGQKFSGFTGESDYLHTNFRLHNIKPDEGFTLEAWSIIVNGKPKITEVRITRGHVRYKVPWWKRLFPFLCWRKVTFRRKPVVPFPTDEANG
jgi:hypothetical protein